MTCQNAALLANSGTSDLAANEGRRRAVRRDLYANVAGSQGRHFIGIVGPRGAGKTVLLKQMAAVDPAALYLSADTLPHDADLFGIVKELADRYKYRVFLIDEVHYLPESMASLKRIYDFLEVRIIFTSSVALAMQTAAHDLARRVRLYTLEITKYKAEQYADALEKAFVMQRIMPAGTNLLREPKVLLVPPVRLLHLSLEQAAGGLREDFFALAMRQAGIAIHYLKGTRGQKTPDFLIHHDGKGIALEIGGKAKGRSQFKGITTDRKLVLAPDIAPQADRLPLHLVGFLGSIAAAW